ncbi:MAG: urate hydroxylase PuuD [Burkholderiales bacterium]|nr:urate hydroxylase PuuD [Burkholderiales bacterium]
MQAEYAYVLEYLNFAIRWLHMIAGIAWIGASLYFVWLDSSLLPPKDQPSKDIGIGGEVWALHGGGFYRAQKFSVAPPELPTPLHWFKWEAYTTWLSGFALLVLIYYVQADVYLIDKSVMDLTPVAAVSLGLGSLIVTWIIYHLMCLSPLGKNEPLLAGIMFVLLGLLAYGFTHVFSGRGAFIHFGAVLGTIMAANVLFVIMPGQHEMVRAKVEGRAVDPIHGQMGKQRSVHNTYFTLPVLFVMISNHYAGFTNHRHAWAILMAISLAGALIRLYSVLSHRGEKRHMLWMSGYGILIGLFVALWPKPADPSLAAAVKFADVKRVIDAKCAVCHAAKPTFPGFAAPPKNVVMETPEQLRTLAAQINQQTVATRAMPPGNLTQLSDEERTLIGAWIAGGAKLQ